MSRQIVASANQIKKVLTTTNLTITEFLHRLSIIKVQDVDKSKNIIWKRSGRRNYFFYKGVQIGLVERLGENEYLATRFGGNNSMMFSTASMVKSVIEDALVSEKRRVNELVKMHNDLKSRK